MQSLTDSFGRRIDYLRLSVTDQCNYHCFYCRPGDKSGKTHCAGLLAFDEIERLVRLFVELGVRKVRLTGGEPLVRRNLPGLVARLGSLPGLDDLSLSTNGHLLARFADRLQTAGVSRVNVSLDSLDRDRFAHITRGGDLSAVLAGIDAALAAGMRPVKINMVVMRGINAHEIEAMLDFAVRKGLELRFIETMPVGQAGMMSMTHHLPAADILARVRRHLGANLIPVTTGRGGGPARYFRAGADGPTVGVISAVSRHFCETCNRVRLTANGELALCLGQRDRVGLRELLVGGECDDRIKQTIRAAIANKPRQHEFSLDADKLHAEHMLTLGG